MSAKEEERLPLDVLTLAHLQLVEVARGRVK